MGVWVTVADVQLEYEKEIGADLEEWVEAKIAKAERFLLSKRPALQSWIDGATVSEDIVRDVVVDAVLRVVRNPEGMHSETEGNYVYTVERDVAGGKLFFTKDDLSRVTPARTGPAGSISLVIPAYRRRP